MNGPTGLPRRTRLVSARMANRRVRVLELEAAVTSQPGQFVLLWLPGLDEKPISIMAPEPLTVAVAAVGPFSRALHRLEPGDGIWVRGPLGRGFEPTGSDHLLVAGGYGAAPLLFLAGRLSVGAKRVRMVEGARDEEDLLLVDAFSEAGAEVVLTTEDGSRGLRGLATDAVAEMLATDPPDTIYACGPDGMLRALRELAVGAGVAAQLSWERYMRCGLGLCGSCEHEGLLLCSEGPVLAAGPGPPGGGRET